MAGRRREGLSDGTIRLRPLTPDDAEDHLAGEDVELVRWLNEQPSTAASVHRYLEQSRRQWHAGGPTFAFGIRTVGADVLTGTVEVQLDKDFLAVGQANIAYGLYPLWRGQGLATRAVLLAVEFLRASTEVREAVILTATHNRPSAAVAVRAGFRPAGQLGDDGGALDRHVLEIDR